MSGLTLKCFRYKPVFPAVEYSDRANGLASTVTEGSQLIRVPLMPLGGENMVTVRVKLIRVGFSPLAFRASDFVWWSEEVNDGQVVGVNIQEKTPPAPDWTATATVGEFSGSLHSIAPVIHGEDVTEGITSPADALWYAQWDNSFQVSSLCPGEMVSLQADYRLNAPVNLDEYYSTIALTTGIITEKWDHPTLPKAFVYWMRIEDSGEIGELYPTDFLEYQIGERVAVIKVTEESATRVRQEGLLRTASISDLTTENLRPAPVRFL